MRPIRFRLTALLATAALVLAACSSGGGGGASVSDEGRPYAEALAASMKNNDEDEIQLTDDQADCLAGRMVNTIGVDEFEKAGVEPDELRQDDSPLEGIDLNEKQANAIYEAFGNCGVDLRAQMMQSFADEDVSPEVAECLDNALTDDVLRTIMIAALQDIDEESPEAMAAIGPLMGCMFMGFGDMDFDDGDLDFDGDFDFDFED